MGFEHRLLGLAGGGLFGGPLGGFCGPFGGPLGLVQLTIGLGLLHLQFEGADENHGNRIRGVNGAGIYQGQDGGIRSNCMERWKPRISGMGAAISNIGRGGGPDRGDAQRPCSPPEFTMPLLLILTALAVCGRGSVDS